MQKGVQDSVQESTQVNTQDSESMWEGCYEEKEYNSSNCCDYFHCLEWYNAVLQLKIDYS